MPVATRSGNVFYPQAVRRARARGQYRGRGRFSVNKRSVSSSSSEEASRSPSPVRSSRVQRDFSINLKQTTNPLYQEIPETMEFFPKDPFQSQHTDTDDRDIEQGNHSRQRDIPRTDRERYHDTDEEHEEMEVLPEHVENFRKDKHL